MDVNFMSDIKNDEEALAVLSALGFTLKDWPFIKKIGSPLKFVSSDFMEKFIADRAQALPFLRQRLTTFREKLDCFYDDGGFLLSPMSSPSSRLFKCQETPLVIYGRHKKGLVDITPTVAVVGSRLASSDAVNITKNLAVALARCGINVVSGGAMGIDSAAHLGALTNLGTTVIVSGVACALVGRDKFDSLAKSFKDRLAVIYPFGPLLPQGKFMFVERNRFVAALASALVVVQGNTGSGTLHTAAFAKELGIPLWAIPGALSEPLSFAPNYLLKTGSARCLVDFEEFAESLMTKTAKPPKSPKIEPKDRMGNSVAKAELPYILQMISAHNNALSFDELLRITGWSFADLQRELLNYELAGCLTKRGAQFVLTGN